MVVILMAGPEAHPPECGQGRRREARRVDEGVWKLLNSTHGWNNQYDMSSDAVKPLSEVATMA